MFSFCGNRVHWPNSLFLVSTLVLSLTAVNATPTPISESIHRLLHAAQERVQQASEGWERCKADYHRAAEMQREASRERRAELRRDFTDARRHLRAAIRGWQEAHRLVQAQLT